jgi:hypothetical protein
MIQPNPMNLFAVKSKNMSILTNLQSACARLRELAGEQEALEERRDKAKAEIAEASKERLTPQLEAKIFRATNIITVCDARLARLESASESEAAGVRAIYHEARRAWNLCCERRRELARASFLTACLPHFDNDETLTAERLAGIMPLPLVRACRAGFSGFVGLAETPANLLREIECFITHVQRQSEQNGIPLE